MKIINFQNSLKPQIKFKINFSVEKYIQAFFDKIANTIFEYKEAKKDEARRLKLEKLENERQEKINLENQRQKQKELKIKLQEQSLRDEVKLDRLRRKKNKIISLMYSVVMIMFIASMSLLSKILLFFTS